MKLFRARISVGPQSMFSVTVLDEHENRISGAQVAVYREMDNLEMMNQPTNQEGVAEKLVRYMGDFPVIVKIRKAGYMPIQIYDQLHRQDTDLVETMKVDETFLFQTFTTAAYFATQAFESR